MILRSNNLRHMFEMQVERAFRVDVSCCRKLLSDPSVDRKDTLAVRQGEAECRNLCCVNHMAQEKMLTEK